jgi:hypothetical protein
MNTLDYIIWYQNPCKSTKVVWSQCLLHPNLFFFITYIYYIQLQIKPLVSHRFNLIKFNRDVCIGHSYRPLLSLGFTSVSTATTGHILLVWFFFFLDTLCYLNMVHVHVNPSLYIPKTKPRSAPPLHLLSNIIAPIVKL